MMNLFRKRSVASITAPITAIVADLRHLMEEKYAEAQKHEAEVQKHQTAQSEAHSEIAKAMAAAEKFESLFS